ncbi:TonB-dependent siderophore receptor [Pedobacter lithocola]|uniref:TonB-dependent siderophore receptor n=1 Tax=Pedobacter lithocola TaxID=1908239 RepID=A0ABV8PDJ4_9SPHI
MKNLLLIYLLLCSTLSFAQKTTQLTGKITDENNLPIAGITVQIKERSFQTSTDNLGNFKFVNLAPGVVSIEVSGVGFTAEKQNITIPSSGVISLELQLNRPKNLLQEVVISANKTSPNNTSATTRIESRLLDLPQSVQFVSRELIEKQKIYRFDEALKNVAGVNYSSGYGLFNFRGFVTPSQNFKTNGANGTVYPQGILPSLSNIERVEVLRGPTAILFGEGQLGGNVNFVTKQPKKDLTAGAGLSTGSFDLFRAQADLTGSLNKKQTVYGVFSFGMEDGGRFIERFKNENQLLYGSLKWEIDPKTNIQFYGTYNRDRAGNVIPMDVPFYRDNLFSLPINTNISGNDSKFDGNSYQLQSHIKRQLTNRISANVIAAYSNTQSEIISYSASGFVNATTFNVARVKTQNNVEEITRSLNLFFNGEFGQGWFKNKITLGFDLKGENSNYPDGLLSFVAKPLNVINPDYSPSERLPSSILTYSSIAEKVTVRTTGLYFQDQISLTEKVKAVAGLRFNNYYFQNRINGISYDAVKFEDMLDKPKNVTAVIPRFGLIFQPISNISFYGDYNTGFIPQSTTSPALGGPFDPETSRQFEVGAKAEFFGSRLIPTVAFYDIHKNNVLTRDLDDPAGRRRRAIGQVSGKGMEFTLSGWAVKGWEITGNFSYNRTRITKSNVPLEIGQIFDNSPNRIWSIWSAYSFSDPIFKGLEIGGAARYTSSRYIGAKQISAIVLELPDYYVFDAMVGYKFQNLRLSLNGNNLAKRRYAQSSYFPRTYFPGTPRNFLVSLSYNISVPKKNK